jgi:hypothetical protein
LKATTVFKTATLALSAPWATAVLVRQVLEKKGDNLRRFPPSENGELVDTFYDSLGRECQERWSSG